MLSLKNCQAQILKETLEEARENLLEAIQLVLEANRGLAEESIRGRIVLKERLTTAG
jgi:predicted RNase H-like HicB family nuclease